MFKISFIFEQIVLSVYFDYFVVFDVFIIAVKQETEHLGRIVPAPVNDIADTRPNPFWFAFISLVVRVLCVNENLKPIVIVDVKPSAFESVLIFITAFVEKVNEFIQSFSEVLYETEMDQVERQFNESFDLVKGLLEASRVSYRNEIQQAL